jgi:hypothetical protein
MNTFKNIQKAEVSPYLFSSIQQKIKNKKDEEVPVKWAWTAIASICLILVIDLAALSIQQNGFEQKKDAFSLMPNNNLYHE